jgi:predicted nucleic acid-binding protein
MNTVFVDTSGFYALLDGDDSFHPAARDAFLRAEEEGWELVTTNYVVHETWAVIQARLGWEAVDAWRDRMLPLCRVMWVDEGLHAAGEARCRQAKERHLSLTDCVSIELMRREGLDTAIAQDEHFSREGFSVP